MKNLRSRHLIDPLEEAVLEAGKPFLGLCLGMQLTARDSYELGHHQGLGWLQATVQPILVVDGEKSIHIGWNDLSLVGGCPLFEGLGTEPNFYFVHRYHMVCDDDSLAAAQTYHNHPMVAAVQQDNILGVQFHPEKSQETGLALLRNFLLWCP